MINWPGDYQFLTHFLEMGRGQKFYDMKTNVRIIKTFDDEWFSPHTHWPQPVLLESVSTVSK